MIDNRDPRQINSAKKNEVRFSSPENMPGFSKIVQPVMPKSICYARILDGNISVGNRKSSVPRFAAQMRLKGNSMVTAAIVRIEASQAWCLDAS